MTGSPLEKGAIMRPWNLPECVIKPANPRRKLSVNLGSAFSGSFIMESKMYPLFAGGHGLYCRRPTGRSFPVSESRAHSLLMKAVAFLVAALAVSIACVPGAVAGELDAGPGARSSEPSSGAVVVSVIAPGTVQRPASAAHWTLREQVAIARAAEANDQAARRSRNARADVSVFPWREILLYAMGVVIVIGGLLAFTGGRGHQSRHY